MMIPVPAEPPVRQSGRPPSDRVVMLRAELWRRHARLGLMDRDDPAYDDAAAAVLALTSEFLAAAYAQPHPSNRRGWLPRPRSPRD